MSALDDGAWVNGTVCNAQQYNSSLDKSNHTISCLTHGQSIGLALTAEASFLSLFSVIGICIYIGWNLRWYRRNAQGIEWKLFQGPADIYMASLFAFDILQAMGGILDVRWAHNGIVMTGSYCTAQGIIQQIGELGVALITLILAVHTFVAALWRVGLKARGFALFLVVLVTIFVALWVALGSGLHKHYESPTPYWCWISPSYSSERLGGEYIWLWLALFASVLLYIPLYFWTEGRLDVDEEVWYRFRMSNLRERVAYTQRRAALGMLLYPLAYSLVVLPLSIARWSQFSGSNVSSAATFFGVSMYNLSGAINVFLLLTFRPQLLLLIRPDPDELEEPEIELAPQNPQRTGDAIFPETAKYQHSPVPTTTALADGGSGSGNSAAVSRVSSRRRSVVEV